MTRATHAFRGQTADDAGHDVAATDPNLTAHQAVGIGRPIGDLAVDADTGVVVATHHGAAAVSVLDPDAATVTSIIRVPGEPFAVAATGDRAYVTTTSMNSDAVAVIDTAAASVIAAYPLAFGVTALAVSPDGKKVFAGRSGYNHVDVAVIDITAERVGNIEVATGSGINVDALRVDVAGKRLHVAASDTKGSRLMMVDVETAQVMAGVSIGAPIRDIALGADARAYVLTSHRTLGGAVEIVDLTTHRVSHTIRIGMAPVQLALSPDDSRAYVVDFDHVAVLCTRTGEVLDTIKVGARPSCLALSADGSLVYVADYAGTVTAFSVAATKPPRRRESVTASRSESMATDRIPVGV